MAMMETKEQAEEILQRVRAYWAEQGYDVTGTVIAKGYSPRLRSTVYEVVTDMVGGLPQNYKQVA